MSPTRIAFAVVLSLAASLVGDVRAHDDDALAVFLLGSHAASRDELSELVVFAEAARAVVADEAAPRGARLRALSVWLAAPHVDDADLAEPRVSDREVARAIVHARILRAASRGDASRVRSFSADDDVVVRGHVVDALARIGDDTALRSIATHDVSGAVRGRAARRLDARRPTGDARPFNP